jgi:hypothetical protein
MAGPVRAKVVCLCGFEVRFGEPPKPAREPRALPRFKIQKNKMPDVDLGNRHPALQSMCSKD